MTRYRLAGGAALLWLAACSHEKTDANAVAVNIDAAANAATLATTNAAARTAPRTPSPRPKGIATASPLAAPPVVTDQSGERSSTAAQGPDLPPSVSASYRCVDGSRYVVRFDNRADTATVMQDGRALATLDGQRPASGIWYRGNGWELRGKGRQATLTTPDGPELPCIS